MKCYDYHLHKQGQSHSKIETILSRYSIFSSINIGIFCQERFIFQFLEKDDAHEEKSKDTIAKVTEDMVEVSDMAQRLSAEIIVVANILVASESLFSRKPGGDFVICNYS